MSLLDVIAWTMLPTLGLCGLLCIHRLIMGPTIADRAVSLDLLALVILASVLVVATTQREPALIDAGVVLALISFFGSVGISRYMEFSK